MKNDCAHLRRGCWQGIISGYRRWSCRRGLSAVSALCSPCLPAGCWALSRQLSADIRSFDKKSTQQALTNESAGFHTLLVQICMCVDTVSAQCLCPRLVVVINLKPNTGFCAIVLHFSVAGFSSVSRLPDNMENFITNCTFTHRTYNSQATLECQVNWQRILMQMKRRRSTLTL